MSSAPLRPPIPTSTPKRRVAKASITETHPLLAAQWHPTFNDDLSLDSISSGSGRKPWWLCSCCGHEWQAMVANRSKGAGCPSCARTNPPAKGKKAELFGDKRPDLLTEFHPTLNTREAAALTCGSNHRAHWICGTCNHGAGGEWQATIKNRMRGSGCPRCSGRSGKSLAEVKPEIAAQWHPTLNAGVNASDVSPCSTHVAYWLCASCGHGEMGEWATQVGYRKSPVCPVCRPEPRFTHGPLAQADPEIAAQWHPTLNASSPGDVFISSRYTARWLCEACGYGEAGEWVAQVKTRCRKRGRCPRCSGRDAAPPLTQTHADIAVQWADELNTTPISDEITRRCDAPAFWICGDCDYGAAGEWMRSPRERTNGGGVGCPACAGKVATDRNSLAVQAPAIAAQWHPTLNAPLSPHGITVGSNREAYWLCGRCGHGEGGEWSSLICNRTKNDSSQVSCPSCCPADRLRLPKQGRSMLDLYPAIAAEWDESAKQNEGLSASQIAPSSIKERVWRCASGHAFFASPRARVRHATGCPICDTSTWSKNRVRNWLALHIDALREIEPIERRALVEWYGLNYITSPARVIGELIKLDDPPLDDLAAFARGESGVVTDLIEEFDPREYGGRRSIPESVRQEVFARDGHACKNPHCPTDPDEVRSILSCDHVIPHSKGGGDEKHNLQALCLPCNIRRGNRDWDEFVEREAP